MRMTQGKTRVLRTPADNPLVVGIPVGNENRGFVILELATGSPSGDAPSPASGGSG